MSWEAFAAAKSVGRWASAESAILDILEADPSNALAYARGSECAANLKNYPHAINYAMTSIQLDSLCFQGWFFLANAYAALGEWSRVIQAADRACEICPRLPAAEWLRAHAWQFFGEWPWSFDSYRYGRVIGKRPVRTLGKEWSGEPLDGKTLFVWGEQGIGDQIQFARFLRDLKETGANVVLECDSGLVRLLRPLAEMALAKPSDPWQTVDFDYHIALMDVPHVLGLAPQGDAYLSAQPIEELKGKVGLSWKGAAYHPNDVNRSIPTDAIKELKGEFVTLQLGETLEGQEDASPHMTDFLGTARVVASLSRLITVDTSVAHLAGALGVPVTMVAPRGFTDPRWGPDSRTDWYSSMEIIHPAAGEEWAQVVSRIQETL